MSDSWMRSEANMAVVPQLSPFFFHIKVTSTAFARARRGVKSSPFAISDAAGCAT